MIVFPVFCKANGYIGILHYPNRVMSLFIILLPHLPVGEGTLALTGLCLVLGLDHHHPALGGAQLDGILTQVLLGRGGRYRPLDRHYHLRPLQAHTFREEEIKIVFFFYS